MAIPIRIRRSTGSTAPTSLLNAELAFVEGTDILYYGEGTGGAGGSATSVIQIGGLGAMLGLAAGNTQTAAGTYTFSGTVTFSGTTSRGAATATTPGESDDSTRVATTEWVLDRIGAFGAGTVTSVALSLPNIFTVSGSPVTSSGTLTGSLATQSANAIFAGPTTGSAAAPAFRALVAADIPDISATYLTVTTAASTYLTGNQTVTLSGDATGSGATAITVTIANDAVTNAKLANVATSTIKGRKSSGTGDPEDLSASDVKDILAIVHTNISDFDTGVRENRLDEMAAPTASVSMNSQKITNLLAPTDDTDAANKAYVDASRSGLDVKQSVRVATTANITLSGEQTIDGVSVVAGNRVLVKDQSTGSQNGIYVCASGSWSRAADADSDAEVTPGMFTFVEEGTANADSGWVLSTNGTITVGTTSLAFAQFSGAGQIAAGDGMTKTGNTLNVVGTADRITVAADAVDIASTYAGQNTIVTVGTLTTGALGTGFTAVGVPQGGTGLTSAAKGSVLVANDANTLSALDGGGTADKLLLYTASSDTISWVSELDGGSF